MSTTLRGSALSSGCLLLNPIPVVDHKYTRTGEARRAFRMSASGSSEDGSFGAAQSKLPFPMNTEELKWFKASVTDVFFKARGRIKRLNESLLKLDNYSEALYSKKPQRYESQDEESGIPASSHSLRPLESILRRQDEEFSFEESCSVVYDRDTDIS